MTVNILFFFAVMKLFLYDGYFFRGPTSIGSSTIEAITPSPRLKNTGHIRGHKNSENPFALSVSTIILFQFCVLYIKQ